MNFAGISICFPNLFIIAKPSYVYRLISARSLERREDSLSSARTFTAMRSPCREVESCMDALSSSVVFILFFFPEPILMRNLNLCNIQPLNSVNSYHYSEFFSCVTVYGNVEFLCIAVGDEEIWFRVQKAMIPFDEWLEIREKRLASCYGKQASSFFF